MEERKITIKCMERSIITDLIEDYPEDESYKELLAMVDKGYEIVHNLEEYSALLDKISNLTDGDYNVYNNGNWLGLFE